MAYRQIEIKIKHSELEEETFKFMLFDSPMFLALDSYVHSKRETKRHKPTNIKIYERLTRRDWNPNKIEESEVPLTDEIKKLAQDKLIAELKIGVWSEYRK